MRNIWSTQGIFFKGAGNMGFHLIQKNHYFQWNKGSYWDTISKEGVFIDPKRASSIEVITLPRNKKEIQAFLGKINFLWRFIPNYAEIVRDIINMLKKDHEVKWTVHVRHYFSHIKKAIYVGPILASRDY